MLTSSKLGFDVARPPILVAAPAHRDGAAARAGVARRHRACMRSIHASGVHAKGLAPMAFQSFAWESCRDLERACCLQRWVSLLASRVERKRRFVCLGASTRQT